MASNDFYNLHQAKINRRAGAVLELSPSQRLVLNELGIRSNQAGDCWPSRATIAEFTGLGLDTVAECIKKLKEKGCLSYTQGNGRINSTFTLNIEFLATQAGLNPKVENIGEGGGNASGGGGISAPHSHANPAPEGPHIPTELILALKDENSLITSEVIQFFLQNQANNTLRVARGEKPIIFDVQSEIEYAKKNNKKVG